MMDKTTKILLLVCLLISLAVTIVLCVGTVKADAPSCWFYDDWGNCSGWCEPGNASCKWPDADFLVHSPGTAWGGNVAHNLNLTFGNPGDAGWAWGPFYCPAGGVVNISVKMKASASAGVAVGLFTNDSVPLTFGGGMYYNDSVYFGSNGFSLGVDCPLTATYFALGVKRECINSLCADPNCTGTFNVCDCTGGTCTFFFNTSGPYADTCINGPGTLWEHGNPWIYDGVVPDGAWHNYAISFNTATGDTLCYYDGVYMGTIHAYGMAGKNLYFQLYGIGVSTTVYWDDFLLESGSGGAQVSSIGRPLGPTNLLAGGVPSGGCMYNATPNLSCIAWHTTNTVMPYQMIMVATDSVFNYKVWDTGVMNITSIYSGGQSNITYNGTAMIWNTLYYWRTRFIDCNGVVGDWSDTASFTYGAVNCGIFNTSPPHGIFPPTNISAYGTDCSPNIFLKAMWEKGATAMGFTCAVTFEQLVLGLAAIPIGIAVAFAVNFTMAGILASLLWFGGLVTMHVYPWWIILVVPIFLLSIWFTLRRTGA